MNVVTTDTIEALETEMHAAHGLFSDKHAESEAAERKLREVAQNLSALNVRRRAVMRECERLTQSAV